MDPHDIMNELNLAAYEMAEAESAERRASQLRISATKRHARIHYEFKAALDHSATQANQKVQKTKTKYTI